MKSLRVATFVGTRPELIKLACVIPLMDRYFDHTLIHTGQNYDYELNQIFFEDLGIRKPDVFLQCAGKTAMETVGKVLIEGEKILMQRRPDAALIYGDTNSCLVGIAAKRLKIPLFHMEAGNRCFDDRVPEEINRRLLDHISDLNMPISEPGRHNLLREGLRPDRIVKTGSMMNEVIAKQADRIAASAILSQLGLVKGQFFVLSAHREENVDSLDSLHALKDILAMIERVHPGKPVIFSVHPRTAARLAEAKLGALPKNVQTMKPLGFTDYVALQKSAFCVLSDSGTLSEESGILGFPAVHLRHAQERPEAIEGGAMILCALNVSLVETAIALATRVDRAQPRPVPADYAGSSPSEIVVNSIVGFTSYIRRTVHFEG